MVEEQVGVEVLVTDLQVDLASDECEALTKFQEEPFEVLDESVLEILLASDVCLADEVEQGRDRGWLAGPGRSRPVAGCGRSC